ncbi:hypothetical protein T492DRAFT_964313 [Pavlovales sp. CCMP2436]|nr:hypothetical protein T492DRAFT_964313 [Pavlovales sp. CCMP2436]
MAGGPFIRTAASRTELCADCFAAGVEVKGRTPAHLRGESYQVIADVATPLLSASWGCDEELRLLAAIERLGFGNWSEVASSLGSLSPKSHAQCEAHYIAHFLHSNSPPLPAASAEPLSAAAEVARCGAWTADQGALLEADVKARRDAAFRTHVHAVGAAALAYGALAMEADADKAADVAEGVGGSKKVSGAAGGAASKTGGGRSGGAGPSAAEVAGYMPLRGEFDVEWSNEAELLLADLEFGVGRDGTPEPPEERTLKLEVCALYNAKLDERARRKAFVLERGLLDFRKLQAADRRRGREERELWAALRPFARLHTAAEHALFVRSLLSELRLRRRIAQLQHYRQMGLLSLAQAELYERDRRARELFTRHHDSANAMRSAAANKGGKLPSPILPPPTAPAGLGGSGSRAGAVAAVAMAEEGLAERALSAHERQLCATLGLQPGQWAYIKRMLVAECARAGTLRREEARELVRIDVRKLGHAFDFCVHAGWLEQSGTGGRGGSPAAALVDGEEGDELCDEEDGLQAVEYALPDAHELL